MREGGERWIFGGWWIGMWVELGERGEASVVKSDGKVGGMEDVRKSKIVGIGG